MAREGQWYEARPILSRRDRLLGSTLGLYSFGNVARGTARRAMAFGLRVIAYDPYVSELEIIDAGVEPVSFGELLERSDYLSVHAPHNTETEHSINAAALRRMKPTAGLINTARGPIVDEAALIEALRDGVIAGAGLDVTETEPASTDNPLLTMDNVIVTPHIASASTRMRPEDTPPRRPRGGHGLARPVADELRQPDCPAARGARAVAALPDEQGTQPMKVVTAIAKAMKAEGVEILFAYPVNPLIEAAAEEDIRTVIVRQERIGLHMADAYSRMTLGREVRGLLHAARPRRGERLRRRGPGVLRVVADSRDPRRLPPSPGPLLPELQLDPEHAAHHQVGRAGHLRPRRPRLAAPRLLPAAQRPARPGAARGAGRPVERGGARRLGPRAELHGPQRARPG